ncbi:MAG: ROK family glucokinase [Actinomycetota bacterium]
MSAHAIGVDVGGTKIAAMRVTAEGEILARETVETPASDAEATLAATEQAARAVLSDEVVAVGVGAAGIVDFAAGVLRYGPNLPWRELGVVERITREIGLPCVLDNDANVAAWGEYRFGAGKGTQDMLLVTVGTGIGGGIVSGGKMYRGAHGFAAEIGHVIVDPNGPLCGCGNVGCWEQVASGSAIQRAGREAVPDHPESLISKLASGDAAKVTGPIVTEAAQKDDDIAKRIIREAGRRLGQGIAGLVNILDPDVVVIGGGVVAAGDLVLGPARRAMVDAIEAPEHRPEVPLLAATLGNDAGAVGAAAMALDELGSG